MKHKLFFSFLITPLLLSGYQNLQFVQSSAAFQIAQSIWKPFSSQEGRFKVLMPGTPSEDKSNVNTKAGEITINRFSVRRENEALYAVAYSDLPDKFSLNSADINPLLSEIAAGFAAGSRGRLVSQRNIRLGNVPGREIRLQLERGAIARGRLYVANKRLYQVVVATAKEKNLTKSIEGFFNSFQIVNPSTASKQPSTEELNAELKQAVCGQNWSTAIKVVDQMLAIAPTPESRTQLEAYRAQLRGLANSGSKIPPELLTGCATGR